MGNGAFDFLNVFFELFIFGSLSVKLYSLSKIYLMPSLREYSGKLLQRENEIREENGNIVLEKKQLASVFVQQEKQITLLARRIDAWYKAYGEKRELQKKFFEEQNKKIAEQLVIQTKTLLDSQTQKHAFLTALQSVRKTLIQKQEESSCVNFLHESIDALQTIPPIKREGRNR